jgi:hypothetical protein
LIGVVSKRGCQVGCRDKGSFLFVLNICRQRFDRVYVSVALGKPGVSWPPAAHGWAFGVARLDERKGLADSASETCQALTEARVRISCGGVSVRARGGGRQDFPGHLDG